MFVFVPVFMGKGRKLKPEELKGLKNVLIACSLLLFICSSVGFAILYLAGPTGPADALPISLFFLGVGVFFLFVAIKHPALNK